MICTRMRVEGKFDRSEKRGVHLHNFAHLPVLYWYRSSCSSGGSSSHHAAAAGGLSHKSLHVAAIHERMPLQDFKHD